MYITAAIRAGSPIVLSGCLSSEDFNFFSLSIRCSAIGVSVRDGAMQFTATLGASSADRLLAKPSSADFEAAMDEWNVIPVLAATDEINTTEAPLSFFKLNELNNVSISLTVKTSGSFLLCLGVIIILDGSILIKLFDIRYLKKLFIHDIDLFIEEVFLFLTLLYAVYVSSDVIYFLI